MLLYRKNWPLDDGVQAVVRWGCWKGAGRWTRGGDERTIGETLLKTIIRKRAEENKVPFIYLSNALSKDAKTLIGICVRLCKAQGTG